MIMLFMFTPVTGEEWKRNLLSVSLGSHIPTGSFKDINESIDTSASFALNTAYHRYLTPAFGLGASLIFTQRSMNEQGNYAVYDISQKIMFINLIAVKRFTPSDRLELYAQGGPSIVVNTLDYNGHNTGHSTFGFTVGTGGRYYINDFFFGGIELNYSYAKIKYDFDTYPSKTARKQDLSGFYAGLSAGVSF